MTSDATHHELGSRIREWIVRTALIGTGDISILAGEAAGDARARLVSLGPQRDEGARPQELFTLDPRGVDSPRCAHIVAGRL
jgi:hypothetical protein